jgi:hypothetical protein
MNEQEYEDDPIPADCTCKKLYNWYTPAPCMCSEDMKQRKKVCASCHVTQLRSCHRNCGESQPVPTYCYYHVTMIDNDTPMLIDNTMQMFDDYDYYEDDRLVGLVGDARVLLGCMSGGDVPVLKL